jgi:hypothetical protein
VKSWWHASVPDTRHRRETWPDLLAGNAILTGLLEHLQTLRLRYRLDKQPLFAFPWLDQTLGRTIKEGRPGRRIMLRKVAAGALSLVLALAMLGSSGQQATLVATRTPASLIVAANEALRQEIAQAMEQAATSMGLVLDTSDMVYICRDDLIVASACAAGFEYPESLASALVADVGLIYVSREATVRFGDGELGSRLPAGFHNVRAAYGQSTSTHDPGITLLELHSSSDTTVLEFSADLLSPASGRKLTASLELDADEAYDAVCLGWYGGRFSIRLCVTFEPAG